MFEQLSRTESDELGSRLLDAVVKAGKLAKFVAADETTFESVYEMQVDAAASLLDVANGR